MSKEAKAVKFSRAVRFDRVSSMDQRDGYSLDAQRDNGTLYANKSGLKVVKAWSVDESASKEEDRVEFFDMVQFVKREGVEAVIFDKVDRACRGLKSAVLIEELMDNYNVKFHFTRENLVIDKNSPPQEKLRFNLGIILAKYYIDNLKTEINKGNEAKRKAGVWNGKAPFGYKNATINGRKAIVKDIKEFAAGKEAFELYASGNYGLEELAKRVGALLPHREDLTKRLIENMLSNPFYYGVMKIKGDIYPATHEPMISKELFDSCQKIRGIRAASSQSKKKGFIPKPLMGLIKCGECGHNITGESQKKVSGKVFIYYRCANHKCPQYRKRTNQGLVPGSVEI